MMSEDRLGVWDYVVVSCVLLSSAAIGIYYRFSGGKQKSTEEYLLADRNMGVIPVAFSLMASFMSAITLLGVASENYTFGTQFVLINISYIIGTPIVAFAYLPVFFNLQKISVYEYLERRFGKATRIAASITFQLQMVLYMGIVLYAPGLALSTVTGLSRWVSILTVGIVCTFYSTIGGMKAVLWTDVFQSVLMFAALFIVVIKGVLLAGGFSTIWNVAYEGGRIEFLRLDVDPTVRHTIWTQCIGGIFTYCSIYAVNQGQVQRLLTLKTLRKSQRALFLSWPILTALSFTTSFCGLVLYYQYHNCDPFQSHRIKNSDQLLPLFVMDTVANIPGVAGIFISGVFSGTLSTVSSACNSLAAVTLEDYIRPCLSEGYSDIKLAFFSKALVLVYGGLCLALTVLAEQLGGVLQASLTIFGVVGGPMMGLFSLGLFFIKPNQKGVLIGLFAGLGISFWIGFGAVAKQPYIPKLPRSINGCEISLMHPGLENGNTTALTFPDIVNITRGSNEEFLHRDSYAISPSPNETLVKPISTSNEGILYVYRISYMWYAPIGFFVTIVVGMVFSLITGGNDTVDARLISPLFHKLYGLTNNYEQGLAVIASEMEKSQISDSLEKGDELESTTWL